MQSFNYSILEIICEYCELQALKCFALLSKRHFCVAREMMVHTFEMRELENINEKYHKRIFIVGGELYCHYPESEIVISKIPSNFYDRIRGLYNKFTMSAGVLISLDGIEKLTNLESYHLNGYRTIK